MMVFLILYVEDILLIENNVGLFSLVKIGVIYSKD